MKWLYSLLLFTAYNVNAAPHVTLFAICGKPVHLHFEAPGPEPGIVYFGDMARSTFMADVEIQQLVQQLETIQPPGYSLFQDITPGMKEMFPHFECPKEA